MAFKDGGQELLAITAPTKKNWWFIASYDSFVVNKTLVFQIKFCGKMTNGENLIIETKGQDNEQNKTKRAYLDEWCIAVNQYGGFGKWKWVVSFDPNDLQEKTQNKNNEE